MRTRDDQELVQLAISGDTSSYGELFDRYQSVIFNYAYGLAGNRDDAGDIAQEAFVKVFEALPRMADRQLDFKRYVYRTAHNVAMDAMRSRKHLASDEPLAFQEEPGLFADPERAALLAEQRSKVRSAASELPDEQRAILEMRELHDMSYQEIADVLDMPRNTVGVYLARARLKLKGAFRMSYVDVDTLAAECQEMLPLLSAYIDDELEPERAEKVRAHLEECRFCTLAAEEMTECSKSYRALLPLLPPAALKAAVWSRVGPLKGPVAAPDAPTTPTLEPPTVGRGALARAMDWVSGQPPAKVFLVAGSALAAAVIVGTALVFGALTLADGGSMPRMVAPAVPPVPVLLGPASQTGTGEPVPEANTLMEETGEEPGADTGDLGADTSSDAEAPATPRPISPPNDWQTDNPRVKLAWSPVEDPSGVTYSVELQEDSGGGYSPAGGTSGLTATSVTVPVGPAPMRWRVWAVDGAGNASARSAWRSMILIDPDEGTVEEPPYDPY